MFINAGDIFLISDTEEKTAEGILWRRMATVAFGSLLWLVSSAWLYAVTRSEMLVWLNGYR